MAACDLKNLVVIAAACMLAGCGGGGGGGGGLSSTPTPPPPPPPTNQGVVIFPSPSPGQFTSTGVWANLGGDPNAESRITSVQSAQSVQPIVRYTQDGYYEVKLPGEAFDRLIHNKAINNPTPDNTSFQLATERDRYFTISGSRSKGFRYSELATWVRPDLDFAFTRDFGVIAFGVPTAAGQVPATGSASYQGIVAGMTDVTYDDGFGGWFPLPAEGTVTLNFDFAGGTLGGNMTLFVNGGMNPIDVGTFAFRDTVYSKGSTTYSGAFDTSIAGFNFFSGLFTGPNAEETIGSWAVPFRLDGDDHQAIGAWIAKR